MRTLQDHLFGPGPKRILSLDGGGVRGLITLGMLQRAEDILKVRSPDPESFRLADYFDLIGGTSTGGIIATLLALRHTVEEIRLLYLDLCPQVFRRSGTWRKLSSVWGLRFPKFDARAFGRHVDRVVAAYLEKEGMDGQEPTLGSDHLKTGLGIVTKRIDTGSVWVLTNNPRMKWWHPDSPYWRHTFANPKDRFFPNRDYTLKVLARATASAPFYLDAVDIGISPGRRGLFLDGGASPFNNPALELFMMATLKNYRPDGTLDPERPYSPFGFDWATGEDQLLIYSVGTGSFRTTLECNAFKSQLNMMKARDALCGMIDDGMKQSLIWCQALSEPDDPYVVDGNLEDMRGLRITPDRLMTFKRANPRLESDWLQRVLGIELSGGKLEDVRAFDNSHRRNLERLQAIGREAGRVLVSEQDFPAGFEPTYRSQKRRAAVYRIEAGAQGGGHRLVADAALTQADFQAIAQAIGVHPQQARKTGLIAARTATAREPVASHWNGVETQNTAEPGDWIVTSLSRDGEVLRDASGHANTYVIKAATFATLYRALDDSNAFGRIHVATGTVEVLAMAGGFDIIGPWGERQTAPAGYLMCNGAEVYGNNAETFAATYELIG